MPTTDMPTTEAPPPPTTAWAQEMSNPKADVHCFETSTPSGSVETRWVNGYNTASAGEADFVLAATVGRCDTIASTYVVGEAKMVFSSSVSGSAEVVIVARFRGVKAETANLRITDALSVPLVPDYVVDVEGEESFSFNVFHNATEMFVS
eukprot:Selendium_serpulae@DN6489_c1_g1_i14.p1